MTGSPENSPVAGKKSRADRIREIRAKGRPDLTFDRVNALLRYDPEEGIFRHKVSRGGEKAGSVAGTASNGYNLLFIDCFQYRSGRVAWLLMTGKLVPAGRVVDHINGDRHDDRWSNLRLATPAENSRNRKPKNGRKACGVYQAGKRWTAIIERDGVRHYLGSFSCEIAAVTARNTAARHFFGEFARVVPEASANG